MKIFKYLIALTLFLSTTLYSQKRKYQETDYVNYEVEMADKLRSDGKIYVVVAVLTTILAGLIVYTITIDRRISRLEKDFFKKTQK